MLQQTISIVNPGAIMGPRIVNGGCQTGVQIFVMPVFSGLVSVRTMLGEAAKIKVSYVSPEFERDFFNLYEDISGREARAGWHCECEPIEKPCDPSVRQAMQNLPFVALVSLIHSGAARLDGKVYVAVVSCSAGELRLVTFRYGGKGWIFRSYPLDFPRVLRRGRHVLYKADMIS